MITTDITIPAYDTKNIGLTVELEIIAKPFNTLMIHGDGIVAISLQHNFQRIIEIMCSIHEAYAILKCQYYRISCHRNFKVNDARSSSLALSIALLNIYREINGHQQINNITGTGLLRIDGSFEQTYLEQQKQIAVINNSKNKNFITSNQCTHLFELENILNQYQ